MKKVDQLILIGGGGHCKACIDVIELEGRYQIYGILDIADKVGESVLGYEIIGTESLIEEYIKKGFYFFISIGQILTPNIRKEKYILLKAMGAKIATIISPKSYVSKHSNIGEGTLVMHGAVVNAAASVGHNSILNTLCNIEHDVVIGSNCHISTNALINGNCIIEDDVFVGSGAILFNRVNLASSTIIGAGSVVTRSVSEKGIYIGNPVRKINNG